MLKTNGKTLFRQTKDGVVEGMEHTLQLQQSLDHYAVRATDNGGVIVRKKVINARGYELIGSIAGVGFIKPTRVHDENGVEVDNPIIRRVGGTVSWVRIREVLVGRAANGNLRAIDLTLSYDVAAGLANSLFDAWLEQNSPAWGYLSNEEHAAKDCAEQRFKGRVGIGGGNCLVYDMRQTQVIRILREHSNWAMLADRTAATIVERNLMRRYLGFSEAGENGFVSFMSWPMVDIEWDKIEVKDGIVVIGGDNVSSEVAEETAEDVESEDQSLKDQDIVALIRAEVKRIGHAMTARSLAKEVLQKHGVKWGDIGTLNNDAALIDIYKVLRNN